MNISSSKLHSSMAMLDRISLHTPRGGNSDENIPLTPCPSPPLSELADMTPMDLSVDDEENVPWCQPHCRTHFRVACFSCFIALIVLTVIVLTVYYHLNRGSDNSIKLQPPVDGRTSEQYPYTGRSSSVWWETTMDDLPSIATSSTIPLMISKMQKLDSENANSESISVTFNQTDKITIESSTEPAAKAQPRYGQMEIAPAPVTAQGQEENFTKQLFSTNNNQSDALPTMANNAGSILVTASAIHSITRFDSEAANLSNIPEVTNVSKHR